MVSCLVRKAPDLVRRDRPREAESLQLVALVLAQERDLVVVLDALGDDAQIELLAQRDDGGRHGAVVDVGWQPLDERPVDLETRDRERLQRAEARIAGAEVVDGDLNAEALQLVHGSDCLPDIAHDQAFRQLEFDIARFQPTLLQRVDDAADEVLLGKLPRRDVDAHLDRRQPGFLPGFVLAASLLQHPVADRHDEAGLVARSG